MTQSSLIRLGWQPYLWLAFLIATSVAFSLGFACAAPLAALSAASALTLSRGNAVIFTGAVWLANQAAGFSLLSYPLTANSFAWGAVLGLTAICASLTARWTAALFATISDAAMLAAAFASAFAVYEIAVFAAASTLLGGTEDFTVAIVTRILETNAIAMVGLLLLNWVGVPINNVERTIRLASQESQMA